MTDAGLTFQYSNSCDFEVHCSPLGLSGIFLKIRDTNIIAVGSTVGLMTGTTEGSLHYNDALDFVNQRYKLFVVITDDGMLRIDFTKIEPDLDKRDTIQHNSPTLVFSGKSPEGLPDDVQPFIGIISFEKAE